MNVTLAIYLKLLFLGYMTAQRVLATVKLGILIMVLIIKYVFNVTILVQLVQEVELPFVLLVQLKSQILEFPLQTELLELATV